MMRLTVHLEKASFIEKERKVVGEKLENGKKVPIYKPKKPRCIINTLSFKKLHNQSEIDKKLSYVRSKYKIAKWKEGEKKGKEMIYISWE